MLVNGNTPKSSLRSLKTSLSSLTFLQADALNPLDQTPAVDRKATFKLNTSPTCRKTTNFLINLQIKGLEEKVKPFSFVTRIYLGRLWSTGSTESMEVNGVDLTCYLS